MARLSLNEVVTRLFDSDDEDEGFGTLDSASEDEESQICEEIFLLTLENSRFLQNQSFCFLRVLHHKLLLTLKLRVHSAATRKR